MAWTPVSRRRVERVLDLPPVDWRHINNSVTAGAVEFRDLVDRLINRFETPVVLVERCAVDPTQVLQRDRLASDPAVYRGFR